MRTEAAAAGLGQDHPYVAGVAEALPLAGGLFGCAWLSTVVHQFDDLTAAAAEVRRVVAPRGRALIRGFFSDIDVTGLLAFFSGIERSAQSFPSTTSASSAFESAGFIVDRVVDVVEPWRFHLDAWVDGVHRIRHVDSMLRTLTDTEFDTGVGSSSQLWGRTGVLCRATSHCGSSSCAEQPMTSAASLPGPRVPASDETCGTQAEDGCRAGAFPCAGIRTHVR